VADRTIGPASLSAEEVAATLGVAPGTAGRRYVEELAAVPLGAARTAAPPDAQGARRWCARLGLSSAETDDVVATLPGPTTAPGWWWCTARAAARLVSAMGDVEAPRGTWPAWEGPGHGPAARCHFLHVALAVAPRTLAHLEGPACGHVAAPLAQAALRDVARHAAIHRRVHGLTGVESAWWVTLCLRGELVELGRLQYHRFTIGRGDESPPWYTPGEAAELGEGFDVGDECIGVHIPEGPPLAPALVDESFAAAGSFLPRHFPPRRPGQRRRVATCRSWLLDPQLADYLPAGSRILSFQRRFHLVAAVEPGDDDVLQFVFRAGRDVDLDTLPQSTLMERVAVAHLRAGGHWHRRTGWLELPGA
jgi:hypothetical protein